MEEVAEAVPIHAYCRLHRLTFSQRSEKLADLADALEVLHSHGVVHQDVKPGNALVDADGRIKLVDLGIARLARFARAGVGTPQYMAPEQLDPTIGPLSAQTDLYALGIVAGEVLGDEVPPAAAATIAHLKSRLPGDRPKSAADVAGTLRRISRALETCPMRPVQSASQASVPATRAKWWSVLVGIAALSLTQAQNAAVRLDTSLNLSGRQWAFQTTHIPHLGRADRWERVSVVKFDDSDRVPALASLLGIVDFDPSDPKLSRRVEGKLIERLADAGVAAIGVDMYFPVEAKADDAELVGSIRRSGIPVVLGTDDWELPVIAGVNGAPSATTRQVLISPSLAELPRGALKVHTDVNSPTFVDVAVFPAEGNAVPSMSTLTALAVRGVRPPVPGDPKAPTYRTGSDPLAFYAGKQGFPVNLIEKARSDWDPNVPDSAFVVRIAVNVPPDSEIQAQSFSVGDACRMPLDNLRQRLHGRVVLIANGTKAAREHDLHPTASGRKVFGYDTQATAIDCILADRSLAPPPMVKWTILPASVKMDLNDALILFGMIVGSAAALPLRWQRRCLALACASIGIVLVVLLEWVFAKALIPLAAPLLMVAAGCSATALLVRVPGPWRHKYEIA
jgi:serine/threonine protein kinase